MGSATWRDLVCFFPLWGLHYFVSKCIEIGLVLSDTWFGRFHDLHLYFPHLALLRHVVLVPRSPKPQFSTMVTQSVDFFLPAACKSATLPNFCWISQDRADDRFPRVQSGKWTCPLQECGKRGLHHIYNTWRNWSEPRLIACLLAWLVGWLLGWFVGWCWLLWSLALATQIATMGESKISQWCMVTSD